MTQKQWIKEQSKTKNEVIDKVVDIVSKNNVKLESIDGSVYIYVSTEMGWKLAIEIKEGV